jgi:hypothetical protein
METKQEAPVSAVVADHQIKEALQKYARVQREVGNEDNVAWALYTIRALDVEATICPASFTWHRPA